MNIAVELRKALSIFENNIAISEGENSLTYGNLYNRSQRVAAYLNKRGIDNACVIIDVENTLDHITAVIGVVISGNYYLSVNAENSSFSLQDSPVGATITAELLAQMLAGEAIDFHPEISADTSLCAFFTSGSTGSAKLVIHSHKNIVADTLRQIADNEVTAKDRIDLVFSLTFSASLACIYPALLTGAEICVFNLKEQGLSTLTQFWLQKGITFSTLSVSTFHSICKTTPSLHHLTALRFISISAEPVKDDTIRLFRSTFNAGVTLQIAYATTETRTISEMKLSNDGAVLHYPDAIGKPVKDKTVRIVDEQGSYLPVGVAGEIIVESPYITSAYYGQPDESAKSFSVKDGLVHYRTGDVGYLNQDGYLFYQGRLKNENKLNGVKINTAEIEQLVEKVQGVLKAAVVINKVIPNQLKLVCFFETDGSVITGSNIKQAIVDHLPTSHLPQFYVQLPQLPITHSGKLNRKQLEEDEYASRSTPQDEQKRAEAENESEEVIIAVFKEVLQSNDIDVATNFFDAGGDSMSSLICVAEIEARFNISLSVSSLFVNPTPQQLHSFITQQSKETSFIGKVYLNQYDDSKRNLYLLNHMQSNRYNLFYNSVLARRFNLIELHFDIYGHYTLNHARVVFEQLAVEISRHDDTVVLGYSFSGFIAQQLACKIPQIKYCVMIDTANYFEYDDYKRPNTLLGKINLLGWNMFVNGDFLYPANLLALRAKKHLPANKRDTNLIQARDEKLIKQVNHFLDTLQYPTTLSNCIYFQASRVHRHVGKRWQSRVGGSFHYKSLRCNHIDILGKASTMAKYINKTII